MTNEQISRKLAEFMGWHEDPLSPWGQPPTKAPSWVRKDGSMISQEDWNPMENQKQAMVCLKAIVEVMKDG